MHDAPINISLSITTNFLSPNHQIISSGEASLNAQLFQRFNNRFRERFKVKLTSFFLIRYDGIIEVVVIMINSPAARNSSHHIDVILTHIFCVNLFQCILMFANYNGWFVDPQHEHLFVIQQLFETILLKCNVILRLI